MANSFCGKNYFFVIHLTFGCDAYLIDVSVHVAFIVWHAIIFLFSHICWFIRVFYTFILQNLLLDWQKIFFLLHVAFTYNLCAFLFITCIVYKHIFYPDLYEQKWIYIICLTVCLIFDSIMEK